MKLIHMVFVAAFLVVAVVSLSAPVALADGTDPIVFTRGCGGKGQPACDVEVLTPGNTSISVSETFTCDTTGNCTATDSVINLTGMPIDTFSLSLVSPDPHLTYSCDNSPGQLFTCFQPDPATPFFTFSGASLCSDPDSDLVGDVFTPDGDECGVIIGLSGTTAEGLFTGETVPGTFSAAAPEPSSALLLLFGLMGGLVSFKFLRSGLA